MEHYILIGIIVGIIVGIIYFIHGDFDAESKVATVVLIFLRIIMSLCIGAMMVVVWAPALCFFGVIAFLAMLAG